MVAEEAVVAVVAGVLIGPGVHTSCSNDRFELRSEMSVAVSEEWKGSALDCNRGRALLMPDLDGGGYCPPLYRSGRFSPQILRLNPLQFCRGHDRYGLGMSADKRDKDQRKIEKDNGRDEKEKGLKERRKDNGK
jgi:hypothetical protein